MSGRGGVGSRERLRLACYSAVRASIAGCRCQAEAPASSTSQVVGAGPGQP